MPSHSVLLLMLVAAFAAQGTHGQSFYSKVASCVAQEVKNGALNAAANAVGIAQIGGPTDSRPKGSVDFYTVGFAPGIGCFLMSIITFAPVTDGSAAPGSPAERTHYQTGAIVAVSSRVSAATANSFTCKFTSANAAATAAQSSNLAKFSSLAQNINLNDTTAVYRLPTNLTSLSGKVRCTYVLYGKTGYNYTDGRTCVATGNPDFPENCTQAAPFYTPSIQWHFDKDNKPAASNFTGTPISITCKVNNSLLNNQETVLAIGANDGACFPSWAHVMTPEGPKPIAQLAVGDKVLAVDAATGKAAYDDVYLMPHRDADAAATYLNIRATPVEASPQASSKVLTLSPTHYVPTACGAARQQQCLKHAREVTPGDLVWLLQGQQAVLARVDEVTSSTEQGFYSPWTLSGSIVVEGFAASTHTAWPYEAQLLQLLPRKHAIAAQHLLAEVHHAVQAPLRGVYRALGKGPLALLDSVIFGVMEAVTDPRGRLAAVMRAAVQATTAA